MNRLTDSEKLDLERQKFEFTPDNGFNLVGVDYFSEPNGRLYLIEHFTLYQDALKAKKSKKNIHEYFILYKGSGGEYFCR